MNELEEYFRNNNDKLINKWMHYFDVYDRHFRQFKGKEIVVLEIGVFQGGSLQMWKKYFGDKAKIYGVDINPNCKALEEENVEIFIGSQSDRKFLRKVKESIPPIDILIDDGGHTMLQQIITFEELFGHVKEDGVYLCEDLHTSYQVFYGGGHKRNGTFIEYSKNFIDYINAYHSEQRGLKVNEFTRSVNSLHYYDSILVVEKRKMLPPTHMRTGNATVQDFDALPTGLSGLKWKIKKPALTAINKFLRFFRIGGFMWR
nr:class I SAM-dependent methyltransferase [uncultured Sphingobacterium sp.]